MIRAVALVGLIAVTASCNRGGEANNAGAAANVGAPAAPATPAITAPANAQASAQPAGTAWQTTPSGLKYRRIQGTGAGPKPSPTSTVTIHYVGKLQDGTVFDSSTERGEPATMPLPQLIPGWQEGVPLMSVGDVFEFEVPPQLGYGPEGIGPIPPNATLFFTIGLIAIVS